VFRKTLRNMLVSVAFFNPLLSLLSFSVLDYDDIRKNSDVLLSEMAKTAGNSFHSRLGNISFIIVSADAFIVLSGAVLTAYVGVTGLIRQIASDRCLPQFLLAENKFRGTNHIIIFGFFFVSSSLLWVLNGKFETLAGVYALAFLGVMFLFGFACLLLKIKRPDIAREEVAPSWAIFFGLLAVVAAICGNVLGDVATLIVSFYYILFLNCNVTVHIYDFLFVNRISLYTSPVSEL
jgi:amino acid transporter